MIIYLDEAFHAYQRAGRMRTQHDLFEAITYGAVQRVRPKLMTVATTTLGLLPALWASGAGAEAISRIAAPMIGGLITSTILTLEIVPAIYSLWRGREVAWVKGPPPPRKRWDELSHEFAAMERREHGGSTPLAAAESPSGPASAPAAHRGRIKALVLVLVAVLIAIVVWMVVRNQSSAPGRSAAESSEARATLPTIEISVDQTAAMRELFDVGDALGSGLASDRVQAFNEAAPRLAPALRNVRAAFPEDHPWASLIRTVEEQGRLVPSGSLSDAREAYLPFSSALVELVKVVREQAPRDAG
jgi:hypothetical protein